MHSRRRSKQWIIPLGTQVGRWVDRWAEASLPDHIGATPAANPDLVDPTGVDIDAVADGVGCFLPIRGVCDCQAAAEDDVRRETRVRVRGVICICFPLFRVTTFFLSILVRR